MSTMNCEHCGSTPAAPHSFHYGRTSGTSDVHAAAADPRFSGSPTTWRSPYHVEGTDTVALCAQCLARARARHSGKLLLREWVRVPLFGFLYALWAIGVGVAAWQGSWGTSGLVLAGGLAVTGLVYLVIYLVLRGEDFAQHAAMLEHEQRLRDDGWDTFWSDKDLARLTPH
jgi:hypothetical protein